MVKEARLVAAAPFPPELQRAALVTAGGIGLGLLVLFTQLPSILPDYPAVVVAFLLWAVLPGWLVQQALFGDRTTSIVERVVVSFVMSMALAALPGLVALRLHWSLETFAIAYIAVAAVGSAASLFWHRDVAEPAAAEDEESGLRYGRAPLLALLTLAALAIVTSPWWAGDHVPRDGDDLVYMGYVADYVDAGSLDASEPFLDTRQGGFGRMGENVWVVMQALVADNAGVTPAGLLFDYLPPLITLLAVAAMFTLARGLSGSTTVALLAGAFVLAFAALDLSPHEGYGRNILIRIAQDKMTAVYVMLPVGLLLGSRFLSGASAGRYVVATLAIVGMLVVHPMAVLFLAAGLTGFACLRSAVERSLIPARSGLLLLLPWVIIGVAWIGGRSVGALDEPAPFRGEFRVIDLPLGLEMASFHLIIHPFTVAAIIFTGAAWLLARRSAATQVLLATTLTPLAIAFVPFLATPLANLASDHALWRLLYLIPVPLGLAYGYVVLAGGRGSRESEGAEGRGVARAIAPIGYLLLATIVAFTIQEQYGVLDDGSRYERFSTTEVLPWTGGSILIGGYEHASYQSARPSDDEQRVLDYLGSDVPAGSTVLAPPNISRYLPGMLPDIRPADYRSNQAEFRARSAFITAFYAGLVRGEALNEAMEKFDIDMAIVVDASRAENALRTFAAYSAGDFRALGGMPDLELRGKPQFWAWALDANQIERIEGPGFTVPDDIDPLDTTLELEIIVAPSQQFDADYVARVGVLYSGGPNDAPAAASRTNIDIPGGTAAGTWLLRRRLLPTDVEPGAPYAIGFRRMADHQLDTYPADLWIVGLRLRYEIGSLQPIDGTSYRSYVVPDASGAQLNPDG